jgi:catechol 2,3-dioxygenase-like lactoylglutathione lyase family enzyme
MFDHVTLRVADLAAAEALFQTLLDPLAFDETFRSRTLAAWEDFALTEADEQHAVTRRLHVAFAARAPSAVDDFWAAGVAAGLRDDGAPGLRPHYARDYYGAFLRDADGNSFEAVNHSRLRTGGNIDHVAIRVADLAAATAFYRLAGAAAGFDVSHEEAERVRFAGPREGGAFSLVAGPPTENLHVAFPGHEDAVRRFYAELTAAGHPGNGEPGERPRYHPGYYAAYVFDPDGNNIEVVDHHDRSRRN